MTLAAAKAMWVGNLGILGPGKQADLIRLGVVAGVPILRGGGAGGER